MGISKVAAAACALLLASATQLHAETLTNETVVTLVSAGLGDEAVIAKIKASAARYDLSTDSLIALKKSGVSSAIIAAMIEADSQGMVSPKAMMSADSPDPLGALTRHQLEILAMIARGWSNERIAEETGGTVRAVERSISRLFGRLDVTNDPTVNPRVAAAAMYLAAFGPAR